MGPFFSLLHSIGLSAWVVERLWLALMLALAVWGLLRLLDALIGRPRGVAHIVAGAFYMVNPYIVVFTARTTITLLGYAALPWLLLITLHGVRQTRSLWRGWRGWWWAAAFALILTSTGGGVNAAVVGWMLVGPLVLLLYEPMIGGARWRDCGAFLIRVGIVGVLASLWWIMPLLVHVRYGIDFLQFTEQPASIWGTNSITESLRLMGYWTSYIGVGFGTVRPFFSDSGTLLFNPLVVGAASLAARPRGHRLRVGPQVPLCAAVAGARGRRGRDHDGRLPRRHAASRRHDMGVPPHLRSALHAHHEQGRRRSWRPELPGYSVSVRRGFCRRCVLSGSRGCGSPRRRARPPS